MTIEIKETKDVKQHEVIDIYKANHWSAESNSCEFINGGYYYMQTDAILILGYYLTKLVSMFTIGVVFYETITSIRRARQTKSIE